MSFLDQFMFNFLVKKHIFRSFLKIALLDFVWLTEEHVELARDLWGLPDPHSLVQDTVLLQGIWQGAKFV